MMTLEEYLTPDPSLRPPAASPTFIPDTKPSRASRKISLHSKGSVRGFDFIDGRKTWYEAELEWKCGLVAKLLTEVVDIVEQPPAVTYLDEDGNERRHTFDWLVVKADGTKWLFAVKPAALVEKSGIERIIDLIASQIPRSTADFITLFTEHKLTAVDLFNAELVHHVQKDEFPDDDAVVAKLVKRLRGTVTIASLVERSKLGGYGFNAVVRAVADGRLRLVEYRKIDYDAVVTRGGAKAR
jgi:hypothetical protein